jgi:hypothetical protein
MKVQFELGKPSHERHFTSILKELKSRGHSVVKTACANDCPGLAVRPIQAGDHRHLVDFTALVRDDEWAETAYFLRCSRDYIRYLHPDHANSMIIKSRIRNMLVLGYEGAKKETGTTLAAFLEGLDGDVAALGRTDAAFAAFENMIPPHPAMIKYLRSIGPGVMCLTPMLMTQYGQTDLIKAAKALGTPVIFLVGSWDNLTTKGTTHIIPDYTFVWNEIQKREASHYHGLPSNSVRVVGAARFDEFWERRIEIPRARFCSGLRLDPARPVIAYLGSSNLISADERGFVRRWIEAVRNSGVPVLENANLLIRPHPKFANGWKESFADLKGVGVSVSAGLNNDPVLYHCLAHARVVVGANTSAELEAAILERPVLTIEDPDFATGQGGTIHFGYLTNDLAKVAHSLTEHIEQLAEEIGRDVVPGRNRAFLESFLRPGGIERPASKVTVDTIEEIMKDKLPENRLKRDETSTPANFLQRLFSCRARP